MTRGFVVIDGRRLVGVTHDGDGGYWWHLEDRVRDYNGMRGPQPRIYRRRPPVTDVVFPGPGPRVSLGWGPTYATCVHGKTWPEGDWTDDWLPPRGRACAECVEKTAMRDA